MDVHFYDDESYVAENKESLTDDQREAYTTILSSVHGHEGKIFFIDGPAGTGKTFLINLLLAKVRSESRKAIAVASTGVAATLLRDGGTIHSTFVLPPSVDPREHEEAINSIRRNEARVKLLEEAVIVFWDQCSMTNRVYLESVDRMLRDLRSSSKIMGGLTFVLSGDFRQILPIIPGGGQQYVIEACLQSSAIWKHVQILNLGTNMRARLSLDPRADEFASFLLDVGNGCQPFIEVLGVQVETLNLLINNVYPDIENLPTKSSQWLCERMIISSTNVAVDEINEILLNSYQSEQRVFNSVTVKDSAEEYLCNQLPPERLIIKKRAPIMLLCNLDPPRLCIGTRLRVIDFECGGIRATILTGPGMGETTTIPIVPMVASDITNNVQIKRRQYPVRICFAITIHKAQGLSLSCIGVDLRNQCFAHGQLYVALSRVGKRDAQFILLPDKTTSNIVYPEVLKYKKLNKFHVPPQ